MATYSQRVTTTAVSGATVVPSNSYAEVTYYANTVPATAIGGNSGAMAALINFTRRFGPGQSIPANVTVDVVVGNGGSNISTFSVTYSIDSGYIITYT